MAFGVQKIICTAVVNQTLSMDAIIEEITEEETAAVLEARWPPDAAPAGSSLRPMQRAPDPEVDDESGTPTQPGGADAP